MPNAYLQTSERLPEQHKASSQHRIKHTHTLHNVDDDKGKKKGIKWTPFVP